MIALLLFISLSLDEAIHRTLTQSPVLKAAALEIQVSEAQSWQDNVYPNPALNLEVENFGGQHEDCFDSTEYSTSISQLILLEASVQLADR